MMNGKWTEVGKVLATDSKASVPCPQCGLSDLHVEDIAYDSDKNFIERVVTCPNCNAKIAIRMKVSIDKQIP